MSFKIGDWIVYKKEAAIRMIKNPYFNEAETKKEVKYPAQVAELNAFNSEMMYVLLNNGKTRSQYKKDFIYATEEEIKNEITRKKLKSIFIRW